jgi:hypothetical protein
VEEANVRRWFTALPPREPAFSRLCEQLGAEVAWVRYGAGLPVPPNELLDGAEAQAYGVLDTITRRLALLRSHFADLSDATAVGAAAALMLWAGASEGEWMAFEEWRRHIQGGGGERWTSDRATTRTL